MKSLFEKNGGTYTKVGDYYLPNLESPLTVILGLFQRSSIAFLASCFSVSVENSLSLSG